MFADLTSPLSAAALGRNTGRTMYPFTFVLLLPTLWNVGFSGEGKMGNSGGISLSTINEGPPESMTPGSREVSPCGDVPIQALSGQGYIMGPRSIHLFSSASPHQWESIHSLLKILPHCDPFMSEHGFHVRV